MTSMGQSATSSDDRLSFIEWVWAVILGVLFSPFWIGAMILDWWTKERP